MDALTPLAQAKTLVIKIGSALLVDAQTGHLRTDWLRGLALDIQAQKAKGRGVVVVSSGSIALGRRALNLPKDALSLDQSQAAAAVGQIRLARAYEEALSPHGITTAQVLLTLDDSSNRRRYLNSRATLAQLLRLGVVPIVNENDTVATDEIRFGDNDRLAAQVAAMAGAEAVVLLSDVDGLYTANPREDAGAKRLDVVREITPEIEAMAGGAGTAGAKGGMKTKIMAARTALRAGSALAIMQGDQDQPIRALEEGGSATWFVSDMSPQAARKLWVGGMKPRGDITVDAGAMAALQKGKSLLPAGVNTVDGDFERGDPVRILSPEGAELARGLIGYNATEARAIAGRKSGEIAAILGYDGRAALIHRDDMVF